MLSLRSKLLFTIAGAAVLAAAPVGVKFAGAGWSLGPSYAFAKDGRDDDGGGRDSGKGSDDGGGRSGGGSGRGDDDGGSRGDDGNGGGGDDDAGGDDRGSRDDHRGGRDAADDDSGRGRGRGRGGDDRADDDRTTGGGDRVEISRGGIEVERRDGSKEEVEGGRYERKDASGRTVEERPATQADIDRLRGLAGPGVVAATRRVGSGTVAKVEISRSGIEVVNNDGSKEEIEDGRYERKDALGRTVEERPATQADVDRLQLVARGAPRERRIAVGAVAKVERSASGLEIVYATGWKEEFENGRYELKDPAGNTVVERLVTVRDRARMTRIVGG